MIPAATAASSAVANGRIDRRDRDALDTLGDHGFDQRYLAFDVGARLRFRVEHLDVGMRVGKRFPPALEDVEEAAWELQNEADLDLVGGHRARERHGTDAGQHGGDEHGA